ncbi:MAG: TolC family protein [Deltaproteobacteria bacterium]|nr:TolC family protein [Deltaproteobacteria bacterium]
MRLFVILALLLAFVATPVFATEPLTLDEALATALEHHPLAAEAQENVNAAEARIGQARAGYFPQVSGTADGANARSYFPTLGDTKRADVYTVALSVKQTLWDFGRTAGGTEAARANRSAAAETLTLTRQDLAFRVKAAYYLLLGTEKEVAATEATLKVRDDLYRQAQAFFEQGVRSKVDVAKAEANLFSAKTSLLQAQNNRDLARVELANAMGLPSLDGRGLAGVSVQPAAAPGLAELQQQAYANRGELKRLDAFRAAGEGNLKTVRSEFLPTISASASYGHAGDALLPDRNVWSVGANLTVPIFSGFSTVMKERESRASLRALAAEVQNERLVVAKDVEAAWLASREASARIASTGKEVDAAKETQTLALERYREGVGSLIEVTDAQAQALSADTANIRAMFDYLLALARLDRAAGRKP